MTINGWEMMIPLAFFAGAGYYFYTTSLIIIIEVVYYSCLIFLK